MLPTFHVLRRALTQVLADKHDQGHATDGLAAELAALPDSYDALAAFGERLAALPLRDNWPYVEPDDLDGIRAESSPLRPIGRVGQIEPADKAASGEAIKFFKWAFANGDKMAEELDYIPMPDNVVKLIEKTWSSDIKS